MIYKHMIESKADIFCLSEYRNNEKGVKLRDAFLKEGYRYQCVTQAKSDVNSVAIFSRLPYNSELYDKSIDDNYSQNIVSAHFEAFSVMSVYLPHKKKHQLLKSITQITAKSDKPFIVVGDYNTGKNYVDQKGNSFWYEDELLSFEASGNEDAFRLVNGGIKEYSWFSHKGNGYRYDHTYVAQDLVPLVKNCYYLHDWRERKLSDHSPMVLELG